MPAVHFMSLLIAAAVKSPLFVAIVSAATSPPFWRLSR